MTKSSRRAPNTEFGTDNLSPKKAVDDPFAVQRNDADDEQWSASDDCSRRTRSPMTQVIHDFTERMMQGLFTTTQGEDIDGSGIGQVENDRITSKRDNHKKFRNSLIAIMGDFDSESHLHINNFQQPTAFDDPQRSNLLPPSHLDTIAAFLSQQKQDMPGDSLEEVEYHKTLCNLFAKFSEILQDPHRSARPEEEMMILQNELLRLEGVKNRISGSGRNTRRIYSKANKGQPSLLSSSPRSPGKAPSCSGDDDDDHVQEFRLDPDGPIARGRTSDLSLRVLPSSERTSRRSISNRRRSASRGNRSISQNRSRENSVDVILGEQEAGSISPTTVRTRREKSNDNPSRSARSRITFDSQAGGLQPSLSEESRKLSMGLLTATRLTSATSNARLHGQPKSILRKGFQSAPAFDGQYPNAASSAEGPGQNWSGTFETTRTAPNLILQRAMLQPRAMIGSGTGQAHSSTGDDDATGFVVTRPAGINPLLSHHRSLLDGISGANHRERKSMQSLSWSNHSSESSKSSSLMGAQVGAPNSLLGKESRKLSMGQTNTTMSMVPNIRMTSATSSARLTGGADRRPPKSILRKGFQSAPAFDQQQQARATFHDDGLNQNWTGSVDTKQSPNLLLQRALLQHRSHLPHHPSSIPQDQDSDSKYVTRNLSQTEAVQPPPSQHRSLLDGICGPSHRETPSSPMLRGGGSSGHKLSGSNPTSLLHASSLSGPDTATDSHTINPPLSRASRELYMKQLMGTSGTSAVRPPGGMADRPPNHHILKKGFQSAPSISRLQQKQPYQERQSASNDNGGSNQNWTGEISQDASSLHHRQMHDSDGDIDSDARLTPLGAISSMPASYRSSVSQRARFDRALVFDRDRNSVLKSGQQPETVDEGLVSESDQEDGDGDDSMTAENLETGETSGDLRSQSCRGSGGRRRRTTQRTTRQMLVSNSASNRRGTSSSSTSHGISGL